MRRAPKPNAVEASAGGGRAAADVPEAVDVRVVVVAALPAAAVDATTIRVTRASPGSHAGKNWPGTAADQQKG
jgi:hypothetical protein